MKPTTILTAAALAGLLGLVAATGRAGGGKAIAWKPFIPADAAKELDQRSERRLAELAKSSEKNAAGQRKAEAAIRAGTSLAAKGGVPADWHKQLGGLDEVMDLLRPKAKGGEGLPAGLQYHPKLKGMNGGEALVNALAGKKLSETNVAKVSKELPLFAYRVAVIGAITRDYGPPASAKGTPAQWQTLSDQMRDSAVALAAAAQKKDAAGIHAAATKLEASCVECHKAFR
jgi:hypothetical protein